MLKWLPRVIRETNQVHLKDCILEGNCEVSNPECMNVWQDVFFQNKYTQKEFSEGVFLTEVGHMGPKGPKTWTKKSKETALGDPSGLFS